MNKFVPLVKHQVAWFQSQAMRFAPDHPRYRPDKVAMYERLAREFGELLVYLEQTSQEGIESPTATPIEPPTARPVPQPPADLSDLPEELLKELSGMMVGGETDPLVQIINDRGGSANLDEILIDLYRKHGKVSRRIIVSNKLYRLGKRGLVWTLPGKKGVYMTRPPSESPQDEGVVNLFGRDRS